MPMWTRTKLIYDVISGIFDNIMAKWAKYSYAEDSRVDRDTDTDNEASILLPPLGKLRTQKHTETQPTDTDYKTYTVDVPTRRNIYTQEHSKTQPAGHRRYTREKYTVRLPRELVETQLYEGIPLAIPLQESQEAEEELLPRETLSDKVYGKRYDKLYDKTVSPYERSYQRYKKLNETLDRMSTIHSSHQSAAPTTTVRPDERYSGLGRGLDYSKLLTEVESLSEQEKKLQALLAWDDYKKNEKNKSKIDEMNSSMSKLRLLGLVTAQFPEQLLLSPQTNFETALSELILKSFQQTPREELEKLKSAVLNTLPFYMRSRVSDALEKAFQISKRKTKAELDEMKAKAIHHDLFSQSQMLRKRVSELQKRLEERGVWRDIEAQLKQQRALKEQQKRQLRDSIERLRRTPE